MNDERPDDAETEQEPGESAELDPNDLPPMTDTSLLIPEPVVSASGHPFRAVLLEMIDPIVDIVRAQVPAYAGPPGGRRHQLMTMAASSAVHAFLDTSPQRPTAQRKVDELFRRMGWGEAQEDTTSVNLDSAFAVGARAVWNYLADYAVDQGYPARALRDVTNDLAAYTNHLRAELEIGHALRVGRPPSDTERARHHLLDYLRTTTAGRISHLAPLGVDPFRLSELADDAKWPLPTQVVALAVSFHGDSPSVPDEPDVLWTREGNRLYVLCPAPAADELAGVFERSGSDRRVVISGAVPAAEAGTALLWTTRALDLVQASVIPPASVIRCEDHLTQLWLHSEPSMRRQLCQRLLQPLLAEAPNSREILSETLLTWLETRDSAPAIASRLDVHPQTIRYRWRRINELFGDALRDPDFVMQLMLVLKASVPLWKGGDQSDFELFRGSRDSAP